MTAAVWVAMALLSVAGLLSVARLVRGPTFADRVVALDTLLLVVVTSIAADAVRTGRSDFLPVLVLAAIVAFVGTAFAARFIEARGEDRFDRSTGATGGGDDRR